MILTSAQIADLAVIMHTRKFKQVDLSSTPIKVDGAEMVWAEERGRWEFTAAESRRMWVQQRGRL